MARNSAWNKYPWLTEALISLLSQGMKDSELIVTLLNEQAKQAGVEIKLTPAHISAKIGHLRSKSSTILLPEVDEENGRVWGDQAEKKILKTLTDRRVVSLDELADIADLDKKTLVKLLTYLAGERQYNIIVNEETEQVILDKDPQIGGAPTSVGPLVVSGGKRPSFRPYLTIGFISSVFLGDRKQQLGLLKTFAQVIGPAEELDLAVINGGAILGHVSGRREDETFLDKLEFLGFTKDANGKPLTKVERNFRAQCRYAAKMWPRAGGERPFKFYFVGGLPELTFRPYGFDPVKQLCLERKAILQSRGIDELDIIPCGYNTHGFELNNGGDNVSVLVINSKRKPFRGAYTRSHRAQVTARALAGWFLEAMRHSLKSRPELVIWTDGNGIFTLQGRVADMTFCSLPKLASVGPTEIELDTSPNIGVVIVRLYFNDDGRLKRNGIEVKCINLAPNIEAKGW